MINYFYQKVFRYCCKLTEKMILKSKTGYIVIN